MARDWGRQFAIREKRIGRTLVTLMAVGFLALVAAGIAAAWVSAQNARHTGWVTHTYDVELAIMDARRLIEQGETTRRGYLLAPEIPQFRDTYRQTARDLPIAIGHLRRLTADNPAQQARLDLLDRQLRPLIALRDASIAGVARGDVARMTAAFRGELSARRMASIRQNFGAMAQAERSLLIERDEELRRTVRQFYIILAIAGALLALVAAVSLLAVLRYTRDLNASRNRLRSLNDNLETIVADRTADLSRANEEIQRFAYIVSHDLRSPLVNVMGFTAELESAAGNIRALIDRVEQQAPDLADEETKLAAREDLPEAIGFIRTSTQKMDRLINAILTLSRQGRRVLAPEPLDLAAIVEGIRGSLAHRLDEEGTEVCVEGALPDIVSDRIAIEQILSNLIENAVKYLHPGRPGRIAVSGGLEGKRAWIAVADNGRGIDPRDHDRVFDLFRRSGAQDKPGEGIGLAHVRALAYRLGGTVGVTSTLGEGATFRLSLPATLDLREGTE